MKPPPVPHCPQPLVPKRTYWRRFSVRVLTLCAAFAWALLTSGTTWADEVSPYYTYHGAPSPLTLNPTQLAVWVRPPADASPAAAVAMPSGLAAQGLSEANVVARPLPGWLILDASAPLARTAAASAAGATDQAAAQLAAVRSLVTSVLASGDPTVEFVSPVFTDERGGPLVVTPRLLVGFEKTLPVAERERLRATVPEGASKETVEFPQPHDERWWVASRDGFAVLARANALASTPGVAYAEPDMIITGYTDYVPSDPSFPQSWGLRNTGQSGGAASFDMGAVGAWDITVGTSSVIALVMDSGVQQDHPDINQRTGRDFTSDAASNPNGGPFGVNDNHGTTVAGCISERISNGLGTSGIAPGVLVASARCGTNYQPNGSFSANYSWFADALYWGQSIGARVSNNSNSFGGTSSAVESAYNTTRTNGMVHFASAGNSGAASIAYPSSIASVNSVAAANRFGARASFSQYGAGLRFTAPGESILTTDRTGSAGYNASGDYANMNGTSFASPYAAGVAALVISQNPAFTSAQVEYRMQTTCTDMGPAGYDTGYGYGLVNAARALGGTTPLPPSNDNFTSAQSLGGLSGGTTNNNAYATKEAGEPNHAGNPGGTSIWYRWTAPISGRATFDTFSSNFDTLLAVYTGSSVSALSAVASNDDANGVLQSRVIFNAVAGTVYYIAVDGFASNGGNAALHWSEIPPATDFSGDGRPDLMWENDNSGSLVFWFMNGSSLVSQTAPTPYPQVDPSWKIRGTGDFNADGRPDVVWENDVTGQLVVWFMNGATLTSQATFAPYNQVDPSWKIVAVGDFDGDNKPDLVWENEVSGSLVLWVMNGVSLRYQTTFSPYPQVDPAWKIRGVGDFNGDNKTDLVWENDNTGALAVWFMNGASSGGAVLQSQTTFSPYPQVAPSWKIRSVADLNADNKPDLVWENDVSGELVLWYLNGVNLVSQTPLSPYPQVNPAWKIRSR